MRHGRRRGVVGEFNSARARQLLVAVALTCSACGDDSVPSDANEAKGGGAGVPTSAAIEDTPAPPETGGATNVGPSGATEPLPSAPEQSPSEGPQADPEPEPASGGSITRAEACVAYANAWCLRAQECSGTPPELISGSCTQISLNCPDLSFSDGSTRTPEGLRDCAEQLATHDCDAFNIEVLPACVTPGTREPGEACMFASQCQSLTCSSSVDGCGACLRFATDADDCNDSSAFTCEPGYACDPDTGLCQPRTPPVIEPVSSEPKGDPTADMRGAPCVQDSDCGAYERCVASGEDGGDSVCGRDPILGEDCREARNCDDRAVSYCELDGLTCLALPKLGEPCGVDGWTGGAGWCESGTACERTSEMEGTCVLLPALGEPCFFAKFPDSELGYCAAGLTCSETTTCVAEPEPVAIIPVGGNCVEATAECHPASQCTNGVCEPLESQGLFDEACRPQ